MVEHKQVYIFGAMFHKGEGTRHIEGHSRGILTVTYRQPPRTQTHGTPPLPALLYKNVITKRKMRHMHRKESCMLQLWPQRESRP